MKHLWMLAATLTGMCAAATAADSERGRMLYETRCGGCHAESVHGRAKRSAADCNEIRGQVARWNTHLGGTWSDDEIDDVTLWLNDRYYRFPTQGGRCAKPVAQSAGSAAC